MRVKKLNATRRPKAGEDESGASDTSSVTTTTVTSPTNELQHTWASPTKPTQRDFFAGEGQRYTHHHPASGVEIGADSPTDPSGVHPIELHEVDQVHLENHFAHATATHLHTTTSATPRSTFGDDLEMVKNHQMIASRDTTNGRKATSSAGSTKKANGAANWREQVANSVRDEIHAKIVDYLKALKPNAPEKVLARLPGLANRMEESLLNLASSQDEYADLSSLAQRLTSIQQTSAKKLLQQHTASPRGQENTNASTPANESGLRGSTPLTEDQARFVFQCLQSWRQKLVNMYGVAPWEILPNPILAKVAVYAPSTEQELGVCGVQDDQIARFGSSLLKELQMICGSTASASRLASPLGVKSARNSASATKASRKAEANKRAADPKKRKTEASSVNSGGNSRLAPAPNSFIMPSHAGNPATMIPPSQLLFRPSGMDTLPTLLPSASAAAVASGTTASSSISTSAKKSPFGATPPSRLSPGPQQILQQPFFSRLQSPQHDGQENHHMHLLAQGAGHMSKQQQDAKTIDMYEKEVQTLRWMLHQSQQEKSQLEGEVQRLRHQLQGGGRDPRQSVESQ